MRRLALLPLVASLMAGVLHADVLVVDPSGSGDAETLADAIAAAAEGDTILVLADTDDGYVEIDGKSLAIVGDAAPGSGVRFEAGQLVVRNLGPAQRVVLRNLELEGLTTFTLSGPQGTGAPGLTLADNAGGVWIEDCTLTGSEGLGYGFGPCSTLDIPGGPGLDATSCAVVTVVRCTLTGGKGENAKSGPSILEHWQATDGGPGLRAEASHVAVHASVLQAGRGGFGHLCAEIADGGPGAELLGASVLFSGCSLTGGVEGPGPPAGAPGPGLRGDAASSCSLLDSTIVAAPGGVDIVLASGPPTVFAGTARTFAIDSPLREGQAGTLAMQGVQGDFVGFFWSFGAGTLPMPTRNGWFLLNPAQLGGPFFIGLITDASGTWTIPITAPQLLPGIEAQTFLLQAWFQYPGGVTLGSGTALTVLDQAF